MEKLAIDGILPWPESLSPRFCNFLTESKGGFFLVLCIGIMEKSSMSVTPEDMKLNLWSGIDNYITLILPYLFTESLIKDFFELLINFLDAEQLSPL